MASPGRGHVGTLIRSLPVLRGSPATNTDLVGVVVDEVVTPYGIPPVDLGE